MQTQSSFTATEEKARAGGTAHSYGVPKIRRSKVRKEKLPVITWYYVQPGFKLLTVPKAAAALAVFFAVLALAAYFFPDFMNDSPLGLLVVAADAVGVGCLLMALQPHQQIFYRLSREGIFCEFRSSASPLANFADFFVGIFAALFGASHRFYINKHSSRVRELDWNEILSVRENRQWRCITLKAGLHGQLVLWLSADKYQPVLNLIGEYLDRNRRIYD